MKIKSGIMTHIHSSVKNQKIKHHVGKEGNASNPRTCSSQRDKHCVIDGYSKVVIA